MENIFHDKLDKVLEQVLNASKGLMNCLKEKGITYGEFQELQKKYAEWDKISKEAMEEALRISKLKENNKLNNK